jgi:hypothetical protein
MNPLAPLLTRQGVDDQVRWADQACLHRGRRLDGQPFLHQRRRETAATLGKYLGEHTMHLGAIHLDLSDPTGIHHGHVGPQPTTALFIGTGPLMFQELQRSQHPC